MISCRCKLKQAVSQVFVILILFFSIACNKEQHLKKPKLGEFDLIVPENFPAIEFPPDNEYAYDRWLLGKFLFYDNALSRTHTLSCASCHQTTFAMASDMQFNPGVENRPGNRNVPSLANIAYHPYFTREGGVPTLEMQILVPIQEHNEFDFNIIEIQERLKPDATYQKLSQKAYDRPLDAYVITRAIANFERSLISANSKYDQYLNNKVRFTQSELNGMNLFNSNKTNCSVCHTGFNFTGYAFENNGLYENYKDIGRNRLTREDTDLAKFKVPGLRNIAVTAPYMHDGSIPDLREVIMHYNSGGFNHPNKSKLIKPLGLTEQEVSDLIAFLETLTDEKFIQNPHFKEERKW